MIEIRPALLVRTVRLCARITTALEHIAVGDDKKAPMDKSLFADFLPEMDKVIEELKLLNAPMTRMAALKLKAVMESSEITPNDLTSTMDAFSDRLPDELSLTMLLVVSPEEKKLLSSDAPHFGEAVELAFPLASEDIAESANCMAFGRYTAVVFHLMRAMELAVQALYTKIGLANDPEREWGKLLSDIGGAIEGMPKGALRNSWSESHANLYHVKQAWRNDVMHPKKTYTEEEAKAVFESVKAFMRHLASLT